MRFRRFTKLLHASQQRRRKRRRGRRRRQRRSKRHKAERTDIWKVTPVLDSDALRYLHFVYNENRQKTIQINTYILTFNQPHITKEVKISYCFDRVEEYVPPTLSCFKCQKYGHYGEVCRGRLTCEKCGEKDLDHKEEDCLKEIRSPYCRQNHLTQDLMTSIKKKRKYLK